MTVNDDKEDIEKMMEQASAHAYLSVAKRCVDNARMLLKYTDMRAEEKSLTDVYDVLNTVLSDLRDELYEEE